MPTYQYACTACDNRLEIAQKFSDEPLTECSSCGGRLRKVFSPVGVVFKGSGFYRTDSRSNGDGSSTQTDKKATASSNGDGSSGSGGSDSSSGDSGDSTSSAGGSSESSGSSSTGSESGKNSEKAA